MGCIHVEYKFDGDDEEMMTSQENEYEMSCWNERRYEAVVEAVLEV